MKFPSDSAGSKTAMHSAFLAMAICARGVVNHSTHSGMHSSKKISRAWLHGVGFREVMRSYMHEQGH